MTVYTVESGDSVYSIARKFGVPASRIVTDNELSNPSRLTVGQSIVILYPTETYTVRGGDTLDAVSRRTGVSLNELWRNNPTLGGKSTVYPGQTLNIRYEAPPLGDVYTNGYVYTYVNRDVLRKTLPYLTYLSVFSHGFREDGSLLPPEGGDEEIISIAKEYGTVPLLTLTSITENGTFSSELVESLLSSPELTSSVAVSLAETAVENGYGGVDLDFEYIPSQYADGYVALINELQTLLPEGYVIFTSLAPKTSAAQSGLLYEGHDYGKIGAASDYVLLMTYEWGYTYGPPLPVSPINSVRRVLDYGVTQIPPEKILMGMSNYGYDWRLPFVQGESKAEKLTNYQALARAEYYGVDVQYDEEAQAPFFTYTSPDGSEHIVWFEDERSWRARLALVEEYGLAGISIWNIMHIFYGGI